MRRSRVQGLSAWLPYLAPALFFYLVFMALPLLDSLRLSFFTGTGGERAFAGLLNYKKLFGLPQYAERYWGAFGHTWYFFFLNMLIQNGFGIFFANALTTPTMRGRQVYQTIIFIPVTLAVLVTGYLWQLLLNPVWAGPGLSKIGLAFLARPWLGDAKTALTFVAIVSCWQWMGIPTMMFVAAFRNISDDYIEAASIEGASAGQIFWRIRLPLIKPVVGMVSILTFVNNFNAFDVVFAMENVNGAPNYSTDLIGTLFYRVGIAGQHPVAIPDPGMGAAIAAVTFLILCAGVIPTLRATQGRQ